MSEGRGRYRTVTPEHGVQYAWVGFEEGGGEDVPEDEYRAKGYAPAFDSLPTKDEYEIASLTEQGSEAPRR